MELITPIIHSLLSLTQPLPMAHSIVNNLNPQLEEMLESPSTYIVGIYKNDFSAMQSTYDKIFTIENNMIFCDLDNDSLIHTNQKDMNKKKMPWLRIKELMTAVCQYTGVFDPKINVNNFFIINNS